MKKILRATLLVSTALVSTAAASMAFAQSAPPGALEEVVVTATRQTSTVNKVALSVSAVTQKALDQQGVQSVDDLSRQTPGFTFRKAGGEGNPNLTIRGIGGNATTGTSGGSPTTGVYLDDVALQQRTANGLITGSNQPAPILFDLDRVEVLRGPQGTLYGGASEGGAIRFITPAPSLTKYSGQFKADVSTIEDGGVGHEVGVAFGGPLIRDKLGARVSVVEQVRAGWIDNFNQYTSQKFASDVNRGNDYALNGKLLWSVTPSFKATVSIFSQMNYDQDTSVFRVNTPAINIGAATVAGRLLNNSGKINGVNFSFPSYTFPAYTIPAQNFYGFNRGQANGRYFSTTNAQYIPTPRRTIINVPSLTLDWNLGDKIALKSVTSYDVQRTSGWFFGGGSLERSGGGMSRPTVLPTSVTGGVAPQWLMTSINPATGVADGGTYNLPDMFGYFIYNNKRDSYAQELRVQTIDPSSRLQFVAGLYYNHAHTHLTSGSNWNEDLVSRQLRGVSETWFLGGALVPVMQVPGNIRVDLSTRDIDILEDELAGFGEATFAVTDKLKITAGARVTQYHQTFSQASGGAVAGAPIGFVGTSDTGPIETNPNSLTPFPVNFGACPTTDATKGCPYTYTLNRVKETPISPKASISYAITPSDLLYFTYAEGFRVGGVNPPVPTVQCGPDLALLGLSVSPSTYQHDTTKSYELGGKFRLFNGRAQVNSSVFKIDWENIQFTTPLRNCGFSFVTNGPHAVSQGFETSITGRLGGFTLNSNIAYDRAVYASDVLAVPALGKASAVIARKGDNLGTPDWTVNLGAQYDGTVASLPAYARVDYMYTGKYDRTTGPGTSSYQPTYHDGNATHTMNARIGVYFKNLEAAIYVKNVTDSNEWINKSLVTNSVNIFTGTSFQPRTVGAQFNYRF